MTRLRLSNPLILIGIAPVVLFAPVILTGRALFWGTVSLQFVPWWVQAAELLRAGEFPLWNPGSGMGAPLLANYQTGLLYPPNWVFIVVYLAVGLRAAAWWLSLLAAFHLAWAGFGMAFLGGELGLSRPARTISGLAFGLSLYLVGRSGFFSVPAAAAWLPWVIAYLTRLFRDDSGSGRRWLRPWLGLSLAAGMQLLAGHAQTAWYTWLLAGLWALFVLSPEAWRSENRQGVKRLVRAWFRMGTALAVAVLLAAAQLLPTVEYLLQSQRSSEVGFETAMTYSFWPWRFLTLLAPGMFGSPVSGDYWGYANYWEDAIYSGLLTVILAAAALVMALGRKHAPMDRLQRRVVIFGSTLTLAGFLLALGKNTPVFPWLYRHIPSFNLFQAPTRFTIWVVFALALMAGVGMQVWRRPEKRSLYWSRLAAAGAFAVTLGAGLTALALGRVSPTFLQATALMGLLGLGAGILNLTAPADGEKPSGEKTILMWGWACALFLAVDLLWAGWGLNPGIAATFYSTPAVLPASAAAGRVYLPPEIEYEVKYNHFMRFDSFSPALPWKMMRAEALPNLNLLDRISSVNNYDPLVPGRYAAWMEALPGAAPDVQDELLNLMGVSLVENINLETGAAAFAESDGRRIRWVACAMQAVDAADAQQLVFSGNMDFDRAVVLEAPGAADCRADQPGTALTVIEDRAGRLVVEIDVQVPGWLVISDTWYPGWAARVDGVPVDILKANYLFRAVRIAEGKHLVQFSYIPAAFVAGAVTGTLTLVGLAWLAFHLFRSAGKTDDTSGSKRK